MSLKQSIVVKSRFDVPTGKGRGSVGGTPGQYILRYMARDDAVENISPTKLRDADPSIKRYMDREAIAENASSVSGLKKQLEKDRKHAGVAFGDGDPALSNEALQKKSKAIQERFENGKTAIETVLSFTEDYLRENGIIEDGFEFQRTGDYKGHIDQLKLRMAIMNGMKKLSRNYDDLHYIGVIQVDTEHVHCHLVMMDYGVGRLTDDGKQRGKLTSRDREALRRGIDSYLDVKQSVKMMSSSVAFDKRNALCYVKRFTHEAIAQQGLPQLLVACLPDNRNHWSANSNREDMQRANGITREFVMNVLQPRFGRPTVEYQMARRSIVSYADTRMKREGLDEEARAKLIKNGEETLIRDCMNGVYSVLKRIPKEDMKVRTPLLDIMSDDYRSMASRAIEDPMADFGFKLFSFSSRLKKHREDYHKFRDEYREYEAAQQKSEDAKALADYLAFERDYQLMLMVKYQYFLTFLPPDEDVEEDFQSLMKQRKRVRAMHDMDKDPSLRRMGAIAADNYGMSVYGIPRGSMIKTMPSVWEQRIAVEDAKYSKAEEEFREKLLDHGFSFKDDRVSRDKLFPFDQVKSLDLHHLGYDFSGDVTISPRNVSRFVMMADRRAGLFEKAKDYLVRTGQGFAVSELPEADIQSMKRLADDLRKQGPMLRSSRKRPSREHDGSTIRIGTDYTVEMKDAVRMTVESVSTFQG